MPTTSNAAPAATADQPLAKLSPAKSAAFYSAYMHPATARSLLAESRRRTARLRAASRLLPQLRSLGWSWADAREIALIRVDIEAARRVQP